MRYLLYLVAIFSMAACQSNSEPIASESPSEFPKFAKRETISPDVCKERGGEIIGDPGYGRIHRPDFFCANGQPPWGTIGFSKEGPIPIEGAVCCGT